MENTMHKRRTFAVALAFCLVAAQAPLAMAPKQAECASAKGMTVTSTGVSKGVIAKKYGAAGSGTSLPLKVTKIPKKARYLAVSIVDKSNSNRVKWAAANISKGKKTATKTSIAAGASKKSAKKMQQGTTGSGTIGYEGPESSSHKYAITVYALKSKASVKNGFTLAQLKKAMKGKIAAQKTVTVRYAANVKFAVTSPGASKGMLAERFGFENGNVSVPLSLQGIPDSAKYLALTMTDDDNAGYVHWLAANIGKGGSGATTLEIPEGASTAGALGMVQGTTSGYNLGYEGPWPPETHAYTVTVYALKSKAAVSEGYTIDQLAAAMEGNVASKASATLRYSYTNL